MLPHVMKVNAPFCSEKLYCVAKLLNVCESHHTKDEAVQLLLTAIERLCRNVNIPQSLKHFDIPEDCLSELAIEASKVTRLLRNNPKQLSVEEIENIYRHAF
jgi:alcohol dehydrogenase class IV